MKMIITAALLGSFLLLSQPATFSFGFSDLSISGSTHARRGGHGGPELVTAQGTTPNPESERHPLIASEEEVKKVLDAYIDRYTRKDVDGLLMLFSPRAIQNRRLGFEEIRVAYTRLYDQSEEIRYRLEDMKREIYENGVEIKARYEVVQLLKNGENKTWKGQIRWLLVKEDGVLKILFLDFQNP